MLRNRPLLIGSLIVVAGASMFAMLGPLSRFAYERGMEPLPFVAWRASVGAVVLTMLVWLGAGRGRPLAARSAFDRRAALSLGVAALTALLLNLAIFAAFERVTVALALLGFYTYPAMVAAVGVLSGQERATRATAAALLIASVGMVLVVAADLDGGGLRADPLGLLLALGAAASQTVFIAVSRDGYRAVPATQAMALILVGTVAGCVVIGLAAGMGEALAAPLRDPGVLPILLVAGSVGAAIPSLLFLVGIRRVGGTRAGILMLFEPVVGVVLAALLLAETLAPVQVLGGAGILAAAVILQRHPEPAAPRPGGRAGRREDDDDALLSHVPGGP